MLLKHCKAELRPAALGAGARRSSRGCSVDRQQRRHGAGDRQRQTQRVMVDLHLRTVRTAAIMRAWSGMTWASSGSL